jgi:hypothetical protein
MKLKSNRATFLRMLAVTAPGGVAFSARMLHRGATLRDAAASGAVMWVSGVSIALLFLAIRWVGRNP